MKKKRGFRLALAGLLLGLVIGFALLALKRYIASELVELLDKEAKSACACSFRADSIDVSLLTLSARASHPRILENGQVRLHFKRLKAEFSLRHIAEHKIFLDKLKLYNGYSDGVGPESATYKFVDNITAPLPSERDYPGRWKLKLRTLEIFNASFDQVIDNATLNASGIALQVERTESNDFRLRPQIKNLEYRQINPVSKLNLGTLSADLLISDDTIDFKNISINSKAASLELSAIADKRNKNALAGKAKFDIKSSISLMPAWWGLNLSAEGRIAGFLEQPQLSGNFWNSEDNDSNLFKVVKVDKVSGKFELIDKKLRLNGIELAANDGKIRVNQVAALTIANNGVDGALRANISALDWKDIAVSNAMVDVQLHANESAPFDLLGSIGSLGYQTTILKQVEIRANIIDDAVSLKFADVDRKIDLTTKLKISESNLIPERLNLQIRDLAFNKPAHGRLDDSTPQPHEFLLNAEAQLDLAGDWTSAHGAGSYSLLPVVNPQAEMNGTFDLQKGQLSANLSNSLKSFSASLGGNLYTKDAFVLNLEANDFNLGDFNNKLGCLNVSSSMKYSFSIDAPARGSGPFVLSKVNIGCLLGGISLKQPISAQIDNGALKLPRSEFISSVSSVELTGKLSFDSGFDIRIEGPIKLEDLAGFVRELDDLSGQAKIDIGVNGPILTPVFSGRVSINDGSLSLADTNLIISKLNGALELDANKIDFQEISGEVNGGSLSLAGSINTKDLSQTALSVNFNDLYLEPEEATFMVASGQLNLNTDSSGFALIDGTITIDRAELQKELSLPTLIRTLALNFFKERKEKKESGNLPNIGLALNFKAERNIFIITNFLLAEFGGEMQIKGTLNQPLIRGRLDVLSGSFGLRERNFEITSGVVSLAPDQLEPELDVTAEATLRSRVGSNVYVILEAKGPITRPRISLASDQGLSDAELLQLITTDSTAIRGGRAVVTSAGNSQWLSPTQEPGFARFFNKLIKIDSISIEPSISRLSGDVEPTLVATKFLSKDLSLIGENNFGSTTQDQRAILSYNLTPRINLSGLVESLSTNSNTAFGADLGYKIYTEVSKLVEFKVFGNRSFSDDELLSELRLGPGSRIPLDEMPRLTTRLNEFYGKSGFFAAQAEVTCTQAAKFMADKEYCQLIIIKVKEGKRSKISDVVFIGENLDKIIDQEKIRKSFISEYATRVKSEQAERLVINTLRADGYIFSRVDASYLDDAEKRSILELRINQGKPVSFSFVGNTHFDATQLLSSLNLFERKRPFGSNTINFLLLNIERQYREAGYLNSTINYSKTEDEQNERINYIIQIDEAPKTSVERVTISGNKILSQEDLETLVAEQDYNSYRSLFKPKIALAEEISANQNLLEQIYVEQGFSEATVHSHIVTLADEKVEIRYEIVEGEPLTFLKIDLQNWPITDRIIEQPAKPFSIPRLNRYIESLSGELQQRGYLSAQISSELNFKEQSIVMKVVANAASRFGNVYIEGAENIDRQVIAKNLTMKTNDQWDEELISKSRSQLLKLGLFSRVEIKPADGLLDSEQEDLIVSVIEKPPRSLEVGGGINSEYGIHVFSEATDRGLFSDGRSLSLRSDMFFDPSASGVSEGIAALRYTDPKFLESDYTLVEDARFQKLERTTQEFDQERIALSSTLYRGFSEKFSTSFGHTILQENLDNVPTDVILSPLDTGVVNLSFLAGELDYDLRDSRLNPTHGLNLGLESKLASDYIGSDASYYSFIGKASGLEILPGFDRRVSLALGAKAGSTWGFNDTDEIPISQRFYLGGRNSVRGFRENSLGPRGSDGNVIGGDMLLASNVEIRYLVAEALSTHVFLDSGSVFLHDMGFDLGDLRYSTGFGVRYLSPVGPVGFDLGHPLDEKSGEPSVRFHFNIGSSF